MKYTNRHGLIWEKVDRIQTQVDMRKRERPPVDTTHRDLLNTYRL